MHPPYINYRQWVIAGKPSPHATNENNKRQHTQPYEKLVALPCVAKGEIRLPLYLFYGPSNMSKTVCESHWRAIIGSAQA